MDKTFEIKVVDVENNDIYKNHSTYHEGDAGLDLFIVKKEVIKPGETKLIDLGIKCQNKEVNYKCWEWIKNKTVYKRLKLESRLSKWHDII